MKCQTCKGHDTGNTNAPNECWCHVCYLCGARSNDQWEHGGDAMCDECYESGDGVIDNINAELERIGAERSPNEPLYAYRDQAGSIGITTDADNEPSAYVDGIKYLEALRQFDDDCDGLEAAWDAVYMASMTCVEIGGNRDTL